MVFDKRSRKKRMMNVSRFMMNQMTMRMKRLKSNRVPQRMVTKEMRSW